MKFPRTLTLVASVVAGTLACADDSAKKNEDSAAMMDAGMQGMDETEDAGPSGDDAGSLDSGAALDSGMPPSMMPDAAPPGAPANLVVKSNLTGVTFKQDVEDNEGLRITSFAYYQNAPNSAGYYTSFYVGVKNFGAKLLCFPMAEMTVKGAGGVSLFEKPLYADSDTKYESFGSLIECLAPGQESVGWTNDLPTTGTPASAIREVSFDVTVDVRDLKPVATPPKLVSATAYDRFGTGDAAFKGTVKVGAKGIENPSIVFYVRDAGGFYRDQGKANTLASLAAGADWAFDSTACENTSVALASDTLPIIDYRFSTKSKSGAHSQDEARLADVAGLEKARNDLAERSAQAGE